MHDFTDISTCGTGSLRSTRQRHFANARLLNHPGQLFPRFVGNVLNLRIMRHLSLRTVQPLNLGRDLRRRLQMMTQSFLKLLDATIHGQLLEDKHDLTSPPGRPHLPTNRRRLLWTFSKPLPHHKS